MKSALRRLRKLAGLSAAGRRVLLESALLVTLVRLGLWLLPFKTVRRLVSAAATPSRTDGQSRPSVEQLAWAIALASRRIPSATCLTQALAGQVLLGRAGYATSLRIGVARHKSGQIEAHAWLETGDRVVIGGSGLSRFTSLPALEAVAP